MEFDEIDNYVNQLFNKEKPSGEPLHDEVLSGDWRIDHINEIIEDAYDEAMWWHNNRISQDCDPRSGLRSLPYVPWDENIDGVAAMMGTDGGAVSSRAPNGAAQPIWQRHGMSEDQFLSQLNDYRKRGLTCGELLLIAAVAIGLLIFMISFS